MSELANVRPIRSKASEPPASGAATLLNVIERAAVNPKADVHKLELLLQMQERVMALNAKAAFATALAKMQTELPVIPEHGAVRDIFGVVQSTFARWEDINEAIKPVLARHGFALSFRTGQEGDRITVTGVLSHRDGHSEETTMSLPVDITGNKTPIQAVGSSTSYGKRYTASALLNLVTRGEDDDGAGRGSSRPISDEQLRTLQGMVDAYRADVTRFCRFLKIGTLAELPADRFEAAKKALKDWKAKQNG
ncbi:ERF family protein [Chthonobacter rhizosphaerae]|uniref:ERF family protein n=1 Tax=Chthonobacter rhizosphaerae TaxID=2735553 RepID=UPI0015EF292E|nr:ERF family protein [Chthonobacter rhizosphaerae]